MLKMVRQKFVYIVAAVLILDFALFGYAPSVERLKNLKSAQASHQKIMSNSLRQRKDLATLKDLVQAQTGDLKQWEIRIPKERNMGQTLKKISQLMSQYELDDQRITPGNEYLVDGLGVIPVTIQCLGDLEQLFGFYRDLQNNKRLIRIQELQLRQSDNASDDIEMETELLLFYGDPKV